MSIESNARHNQARRARLAAARARAQEPARRRQVNAAEQAARNRDPAILAANEPAQLLAYAQRLAAALAKKHYPEVAEKFTPYADLFGVLEQIDNMTAGLTRAQQSAITVPVEPAHNCKPLSAQRAAGNFPA